VTVSFVGGGNRSTPLHLGITLARPGTILPVIREKTPIERNKNVKFWNQSGNVKKNTNILID
jgi:hypothetical protein